MKASIGFPPITAVPRVSSLCSSIPKAQNYQITNNPLRNYLFGVSTDIVWDPIRYKKLPTTDSPSISAHLETEKFVAQFLEHTHSPLQTAIAFICQYPFTSD
jgi:hypothetical protein